MEAKVNYAAVGVFVIVLGAALIAAILWLAAGAGSQKHYATYLAVVDESVAGLNLDAPVKYLGVNVGKVIGIRLDPHNPKQVRLQFAIEHGTPVKTDTEAVLKTQGLTGIAYVELTGGSANAPLLTARPDEPYPQIRTKPSLSARLENVLTSVLANLDHTAANINAVLNDENRAAFKNILADTSDLMRTLAAQKATISSGIADASRTAANTAQASAQLDAMLTKISASADAVNRMAATAGATAADARQTVGHLNAGVTQFTSQTLPQMARLLDELRVLAASLRRVSDQTERNPSSLLRGRQPVPAGPGEKSTP
jgi:phospholipid/cholesterol/gamma-HCH transport system substrate-binding protein